MNNTNNNTNLQNKTIILEQDKDLKINHAELKDLLDQHLYPFLKSRGKETVVWDKNSIGNMVDTVNQKLSQSGITENKVKSLYEQTVIWQNTN
jgi:hypothetical protein